MSVERVKIYIDGGNTYKALFADHKDENGTIIPGFVKPGELFNYKEFALALVSDRELCGITYYIGIIRNFDHTEKSQKMVSSQQKFLSNLEKDGFVIERGRVVYDHNIREKGVDVKIAIDLVVDGIEDTYDTAIVVSSDTDLIPAIKYVQSKGKNVEYIGFSKKMVSLGLMRESDAQRVFGAHELSKFIHPKE